MAFLSTQGKREWGENPQGQFSLHFLARHAFVRMNRAISMMFVRPSVWDGRALWSYGAH